MSCAQNIEPQDSCNFVQNSQGQRVSWKRHLPIALYVHESFPQDYYEALKRAAARWDHDLRRQVFHFLGVNSGANDGGTKDQRSVIYFMHDWDSDHSVEQARTTIYWTGDLIQEADIRVNAFRFSFFSGDEKQPGKIDMESLMVHELGHVLGLQHNSASPSVMAPSLHEEELRREPRGVDLASVQCEYGN